MTAIPYIDKQRLIEEKLKLFYDNVLSIQPIIGFVLYVLLILEKLVFLHAIFLVKFELD